MNDIPRIPSIKDREFKRTDGELYLHVEPVELDHNNRNEGKDFLIPTFVQEEDDFVGLSIDAFREKVMAEEPNHKEYYLEMQQLLSMMKRFQDAQFLGRKHPQYKKLKVNLSASGIAFPSDVAYHADHLLRVCLFFPKAPFTHMSVVAEVVRSEKVEIGYEIKAQFKDMNEEHRNQLLQFVEECQKCSSSPQST